MSRKSRDGKDHKPSYWTIPFVTKVTKLPLTNIRIDVPDVKLNDSDMAKFMCDIVCFVNISDPILAAERTGLTTAESRYEEQVEKVAMDFKAIMESIGRTVATKQTILEIYKDRNKLDEAVTAEVQKVFPQWGLSLVDLEIKDLKDVQGSTIISDIERKQAAQINADARVKIATEARRAQITEAETTRDAQLRTAEMEEEWKKRQIQKDQALAIAEQEKNKTQVEANRVILVGNAENQRQAIEKEAQATKIQTETIAEGEAARVNLVGSAEAEIIQKKKEADAAGTEKLAMAQQKFNDAATKIEAIKATKDVQIAYANAYAEAFKTAKVNIVAGSTQEIFKGGGLIGNVAIGPKEGASIQQFLDLNPELAGLVKDKLMGNKPKPEPKE